MSTYTRAAPRAFTIAGPPGGGK